MPSDVSPLRFGLIGCGAWGSHHARAIAKTAGARDLAVNDSQAIALITDGSTLGVATR